MRRFIFSAVALFFVSPPLTAQPPPLDWQGEPLPKGAVARLGTRRFQHGCSLEDLVLSWDGKTLVSVGESHGAVGGSIRLWDMASGKLLREFACANQYHSITLFEMATGQKRGEVRGSWTRGLAFSPRGDSLAVVNEHVVDLWDLGTLKQYATLDSKSEPRRVLWSKDGTRLFTATSDASVLVWPAPPLPPRAGKLTPEECAVLWEKLGSGDGEEAFAAHRRLRAAPEAATRCLRAKLEAVPTADAAEIQKRLEQLSSERYAVRKEGEAALEQLGPGIVTMLDLALKKDRPLESRRRIERLRENLLSPPREGRFLRIARAIEVLENLEIREAQDALSALARGPAHHYPAVEARKALLRLAPFSRPLPP